MILIIMVVIEVSKQIDFELESSHFFPETLDWGGCSVVIPGTLGWCVLSNVRGPTRHVKVPGSDTVRQERGIFRENTPGLGRG